MKKFIINISLGVALFAAQAMAASGSGNGGDEIRANFLLQAQGLVQSLAGDAPAATKAREFGIDPARLRKVLTTSVVTVVEGPLFDNTGSRVDALGKSGSIRLERQAWGSSLASGRDLRLLILHEVLRATGAYNDDDYRLSRPLLESISFAVQISQWAGDGSFAEKTDPCVQGETPLSRGYTCQVTYRLAPEGLRLSVWANDNKGHFDRTLEIPSKYLGRSAGGQLKILPIQKEIVKDEDRETCSQVFKTQSEYSFEKDTLTYTERSSNNCYHPVFHTAFTLTLDAASRPQHLSIHEGQSVSSMHCGGSAYGVGRRFECDIKESQK